jgi:hypothetical protein
VDRWPGAHGTGSARGHTSKLDNNYVHKRVFAGAASWGARAFLGLAGLVEGAPADVVVYDEDPRADFDQLGVPRAVVLRGVLMHRRS